MATVEFENGISFEVEGEPTDEDIEFLGREAVRMKGEKRATLQQEAAAAQQEAQKSTGRRFAGELAKEVLRQPTKFAASAAAAPFDIARGVAGKLPFVGEIPGIGKTFQAEAADTAGEIIEGRKPLTAALRPFAEVPLAAAEATGVGKGFGALRDVRRGAQALKKTAPALTKAKELVAKEAGRVKKTIFGKVKLIPNARDKEVAESVKNIAVSRNPFKNINRIRMAIGKTDEVVREGIKKNDRTYNSDALHQELIKAKEQSRVVFGSDETLEKAYNSVVDEMMNQVEKVSKTAGGVEKLKRNTLSNLLQARKNFDKVIVQKFPRLFSNLTSDAPRTNAVLDVRRAVNDFISSHLPPQSEFRRLLHKENLMFDAIRNIAAKSPKVGTGTIGRFLKKPSVQIGAGIIGGGTILGAAQKLFGGESGR